MGGRKYPKVVGAADHLAWALFLLFFFFEETTFSPHELQCVGIFLHELPTVLLCPHELRFCAQKLIPLVNAVNSNSQPVTLHHFAPMNYNALSLYSHELQYIVTLPP
jgi:hypothetical protein